MARYPVPDGVALSRATYLSVADAKGCDPLDLPPLACTISTDDLDALAEQPGVEDLSVTFEYAECTVTVSPEEVRVDVGESTE